MGLVARIGRAGLCDQECLQPGVLDALPHKGHVLEVATLLPHERHAHLSGSELLREESLEVGRRLCNGLRVVLDDFGTLNLLTEGARSAARRKRDGERRMAMPQAGVRY